MKRYVALIALLVIICFAHDSFAVEPPAIFEQGLNAFKKSGHEEAFNILLKGSPLENDMTTMMNLKGGIVKIESAYGKMIGHELLKSFQISPSVIRAFAILLFEKGPVYMYADCYKGNAGWVIPEIKIHTSAHFILPKQLLFQD